ncbi:MAG: filamentous hemagglutinin N-terminal domain-containing protein [Pseudanabaenaceae cyanobacterium]
MIIKKNTFSGLVFTSVLALTGGAYAQSITSANDGLRTTVNQLGNQYQITGGTQAGGNLFHSLQKFGVPAGQVANFISNPNIQNILTRVTGGEASLVNGLVQVSGGNSNLFIMNPAGIVFGQGARLDVPGSFTATTATGIQVGNGWFGVNSSVDQVRALTGNPNGYGFTAVSPTANGVGQPQAIVNQGDLHTKPGQSITLVGGVVVNTGTITTPQGNITIAATADNKFVRVSSEGNVMSLELPIAEGKNLGNAKVIRGVDLPTLLTGRTPGAATVSGSLNAAGTQGGTVQVLGTSVAVAGANINVNGTNGGGTVLIGGNYQGQGTTPRAAVTSVDAKSVITADATNKGNGGRVIVWADGTTRFDSKISAQGGTAGGNGGFVETSGKTNLVVGKAAGVNTSAPQGKFGTWLLDPENLTVGTTGTGAIDGAGDNSTTDSTIAAKTVVDALNTTNVTLTATKAITVDEAIDASGNTKTVPGDLTLKAATANLNAPITLQSKGVLSGTATTVNVGAKGTVQNGVDVAAAGGTVKLAAATYTLANQVLIDKDLTLTGAGSAATTVSGDTKTRVFNIGSVTPSKVNISGLKIADGVATGIGTDGYGGGILVGLESSLNLDKADVSNNKAQTSGGGIFSRGVASLQSTAAVNVTNSTFSKNSTDSLGSGGAIGNGTGELKVSQSTFTENTADSAGGAISNAGKVSIEKSTFSKNSANVTGNGGAIANDTGELKVSQSTFTENTAGSAGGAISNAGKVAIEKSTFSKNSASTSGAVGNGLGELTVTSSTFDNNTSTGIGGGGAIGNAGGKISVVNSTFSANTAKADNGGAIANANGAVIVDSSTFYGNNATIGKGGAIANSDLLVNPPSKLQISNSILVGNTAISGAQVFSDAATGPVLAGANVIGDTGVLGIVGTTTGETPFIPKGDASTVINTTLAENGGPTKTHALAANSIALNAASTKGGATLTTTDQRGTAPSGKRDIGAFEFVPPPTVEKPDIDPEKETKTRPADRDDDDDKGGRPRGWAFGHLRRLLALMSSDSVTFISLNDIALKKFDGFVIVIVKLMNQEGGGTIKIRPVEIFGAEKASILTESSNQTVVKVAVTRSISKFVGAEFVKLVDVDFEGQGEQQLILVRVRKAPKPVKVRLIELIEVQTTSTSTSGTGTTGTGTTGTGTTGTGTTGTGTTSTGTTSTGTTGTGTTGTGTTGTGTTGTGTTGTGTTGTGTTGTGTTDTGTTGTGTTGTSTTDTGTTGTGTTGTGTTGTGTTGTSTTITP